MHENCIVIMQFMNNPFFIIKSRTIFGENWATKAQRHEEEGKERPLRLKGTEKREEIRSQNGKMKIEKRFTNHFL